MAIIRIMLHSKIVTHLMGHGCGHHSQHLAMLHAHAAGEHIGANGALQRLAHNAAIERLFGQQLGIIVGMVHHQLRSAVIEEIV